MTLKELKKDDKNLLDYVFYFKDLSDTKKYFNEMIILYGDKTINETIESIYHDDGLESIADILNLNSDKWGDINEIKTHINELALQETEIKTDIKTDDNVDKTNLTENETSNKDYSIAYDSNLESDKGGENNSDKTNITENEKSMTESTTSKKYVGYNKDRINYLNRLIEKYSDYRYYIYNDIVNLLCLKIYI